MWQIIRPDSISALEEPMIKKVLPRYVKIAQNRLPVKFQTAKQIPCNFDDNMKNGELWKIHEKAVKKFYKVVKTIDNGEIKLDDLPVPKNSLLDLKILITRNIMKSCELCERKCGVNRLEGKIGVCRVGNESKISSEFTHLGEESHVSPSHTIFFMGCTMHCQFCQNYSISQWLEQGIKIKPERAAAVIEMRRIEGCRNVNFVGGEPTPNLLFILETLKFCDANVPVVWNSNFYMSEPVMRILDGIVDMHLSDFKYGNNECGLKLSKTKNYFDVCTRNHLIAPKTTEITLRHLILPNHVECCTKPVLEWVANNIKDKCIVNLMDQYRPEYKAHEYPEINRRITHEEFDETIKTAERLGLNFIT